MQALAVLLGVDEAVAGQDRAEMDAGRARPNADFGRQRLERETGNGLA
jgi:hypothetical protein